MPDVTCIMATFQQHPYLEEAVGSILNQTYKDLSLILVTVIGDEPTNTIAKKLAKQDSRMKILQAGYACHPHQRNVGLSQCQTRWSFFADSDDIWYKDTVEKFLSVAKEKKAVVVYPDFTYVGSLGKPSPGDGSYSAPSIFSVDKLLEGCFITDCSFIDFEAVRRFFPMSLADGNKHTWAVWCKIAKIYPDRFFHLGASAFLYRQHPETEGCAKSRDQLRVWKPIVLGGLASLESFYTGWELKPEGPTKRREIVYSPAPKTVVENLPKLQFRKTVVQWAWNTYNNTLTTALSLPNVIHVTSDESLIPKLRLPRTYSAHLVRSQADVLYWVYNDVYPGLGEEDKK